MILNASKLATFLLCKRKAFNVYHRGLRGEPTQGMVDGSAFHAGVAHGLATNDWGAAQTAAKSVFDEEMGKKLVLPGEEGIVADNLRVVEQMIRCYDEAYRQHPLQTLMPECRFKVNVPNTEHNDITTHWLEPDTQTGELVERWNHFWYLDKYPEPGEAPPSIPAFPNGVKLDKMSPQAILDGDIYNPHTTDTQYKACPCWLPHQIRGITDAIVKWGNFVWLLEHKTSAKVDEIFWSEFLLDLQITMYLYGIHKSTGILPKGAIINAIRKPSEGQVRSWNRGRSASSKQPLSDYISFSREPVTREPEDLERFEQELIWSADEWEERILRGHFPLSPVKGICTNFNRLCQFHSLCVARDSESELVAIREKLGGKVPPTETEPTPPVEEAPK